MGLLKNCKYTVIGPIQYGDGQNVRKIYNDYLSPLGLVLFDHYNNPFLGGHNEVSGLTSYFNKLLEEEKYEELESYKDIRLTDLSIIDRVDFVIFDFNPDVLTVGSWEEMMWANRLKKPILFVNTAGKKRTPFWIFWVISSKYVYGSREEAVEMIKQINSGDKELDSNRWKLLKEEYR